MREINREIRGHKFLPTVPTLPALYSTEETEAEEKVIYLHYTIPAAHNFHIFIAELDTEEGLGFGYSCLGDLQNAEWGYVSLSEIEAVSLSKEGSVMPVIFERDTLFTPKPFKECKLLLEE